MKLKTYMAGPLYRTIINPIIMFDSTDAWSHLDELEVKLEVKTTDSPTVWITAAHECFVKNKAGIYSDPSLARDGETTLVNGYASMNYDTWVRHDPWTIATYFTDILQLSAVDLNVHGNSTSHNDGNPTSYDFATVSDYSAPLSSKIGAGLPPFNTSKWPPLNFVHYNACEVGKSPSWVGVLYPGQNFYSLGVIEDQAVMAYNVFTLDTYHDETSDALMGELTAGYTLYHAKYELENCGEIYVRDTIGGVDRLIEVDDIVILGDITTRLTSVYTGTNVNPVGWWRVVQED